MAAKGAHAGAIRAWRGFLECYALLAGLAPPALGKIVLRAVAAYLGKVQANVAAGPPAPDRAPLCTATQALALTFEQAMGLRPEQVARQIRQGLDDYLWGLRYTTQVPPAPPGR